MDTVRSNELQFRIGYSMVLLLAREEVASPKKNHGVSTSSRCFQVESLSNSMTMGRSAPSMATCKSWTQFIPKPMS